MDSFRYTVKEKKSSSHLICQGGKTNYHVKGVEFVVSQELGNNSAKCHVHCICTDVLQLICGNRDSL